MKKTCFLFLIILLFFKTNAQENKLRIIPFYENDSADIEGVMSLLEIDIVKFKLSKEFYNNRVHLVIDEYTKGKEKEIYNTNKTMSKSLANFSMILNDSSNDKDFELRFYIKKTDTLLKHYFQIIRAGFENKLSLKRGKQYSYKDVYDLENNKYKIILGEKFPVWTYTQPVAKRAQKRKYSKNEDVAEFCGIGGGQVPFTEWYKKLGIEHFFIFSIIVEKP